MPASMLSAELKLYRLNAINSQGVGKQWLTCGKNSLEEVLHHKYILGAFTLQYVALTTHRDKLKKSSSFCEPCQSHPKVFKTTRGNSLCLKCLLVVTFLQNHIT